MKIYFASFLEPENCGSGKKYAITTSKPDDFEVDGKVAYLTPSDELIENYKIQKLDNQKEASDNFNNLFESKLYEVYISLENEAKELNKSEIDFLPFKDGDTLLSWERDGYNNYRGKVATLFKKLGYEVILK